MLFGRKSVFHSVALSNFFFILSVVSLQVLFKAILSIPLSFDLCMEQVILYAIDIDHIWMPIDANNRRNCLRHCVIWLSDSSLSLIYSIWSQFCMRSIIHRCRTQLTIIFWLVRILFVSKHTHAQAHHADRDDNNQFSWCVSCALSRHTLTSTKLDRATADGERKTRRRGVKGAKDNNVENESSNMCIKSELFRTYALCLLHDRLPLLRPCSLLKQNGWFYYVSKWLY